MHSQIKWFWKAFPGSQKFLLPSTTCFSALMLTAVQGLPSFCGDSLRWMFLKAVCVVGFWCTEGRLCVKTHFPCAACRFSSSVPAVLSPCTAACTAAHRWGIPRAGRAEPSAIQSQGRRCPEVLLLLWRKAEGAHFGHFGTFSFSDLGVPGGTRLKGSVRVLEWGVDGDELRAKPWGLLKTRDRVWWDVALRKSLLCLRVGVCWYFCSQKHRSCWSILSGMWGRKGAA